MSIAKYVLGVGFLFSALTIFFILSIFGALFAIITYPISILLRIVGWGGLGRRLRRLFITSLSLLVLAPIFFYGISNVGSFAYMLGVSKEEALVYAVMCWAIYSFVEFVSYISLALRGNKLFLLAAISIIGIAIIVDAFLRYATVFASNIEDSLSYIYIAFPFLIISSLMAAISSFRLKL